MVTGMFSMISLLVSGTVVQFNAAWKPERPFPIDMAAFAVNISLILTHPNAGFKYEVPRGYQVPFRHFIVQFSGISISSKSRTFKERFRTEIRTMFKGFRVAHQNRKNEIGESRVEEDSPSSKCRFYQIGS